MKILEILGRVIRNSERIAERFDNQSKLLERRSLREDDLLLRDWKYSELSPPVFRETILSSGALMLRNAVDPAILKRIGANLEKLFADYGRISPAEFTKHLASPDPEERDFWEQIKLSHIFDRTFKVVTQISYFDILRQSGLWDLAARAFPESEIAESPVANSRRISAGELGQLWDQPIQFHLDAQFFYDEKLSINFWTPLVACGIEAPGLKVLPLGVARTREYLEHNPAGYEPTSADIALMHKFRCCKMDTPMLDANGILQHVWAPEFQPGDVLAFTNFTMHATHYTPSMTRPRTSVEVRIDLPEYRFD